MNRPPLSLKIVLAGALAASPLSGAHGAPAPDHRIRSVDYDPAKVVRVTGALRTVTQIVFASGEAIEHVAAGDASGWEIAADGAVLFIKPRNSRSATNLLVTTATSEGSARQYAFEIDVAGASGHAPSHGDFVIRFRYPAEDAARLSRALSSQAAALEQKIVQLKLERGAVEGPRNLAYELQGDLDLAPSEVSDNGRFTVMRFPAGQALPAIYVAGRDGAERLARYDVRGEFVVIHQAGALFRLRRGREQLCVINRAFDPRGASTATLTASPEVVRTTRPQP